jgi:hypothetical protein
MLRSLFLFALIGFCSLHKIESANNILSLKAKLGSFENHGKDTSIIIKTTLKNNTSDSVIYLTMTCSWDDFYTFNFEKYKIDGQLCYSNYPIWGEIAAHGKIERELKLIINNHPEYYNMKFKVGFLFIDEHSKVPPMRHLLTGDSLFIINKEKIVWSNELKMK